MEFKFGWKLDTEDFDFYKQLKQCKKWDLVEDLYVVFYGDWELFVSLDWFGTKKSGAFNIIITKKYFDNDLFYFKKTRYMKRVRKYIVEAHFYAQKLYELFNNPVFNYNKYFLTKKQINEIKNSPPDTFLNPISRIEKKFNEFVNYTDFEI